MQSGGATSFAAHTWPDDALQGAGLPVAAQAATAGDPAAERDRHPAGPRVQRPRSTAGRPTASAARKPMAANGTALPPGVVRATPEFPGAGRTTRSGCPPAPTPARRRAGRMLVIHGGGWVTTGTGAVQASRAEADRWRARGFEDRQLHLSRLRPLSPPTRPWFYDQARARFGAARGSAPPGISAGAHLALLPAAHAAGRLPRRQPAGPTDLRKIQPSSPTTPPPAPSARRWAGAGSHNLAAAAFGEENLASVSPAASATGSLRNHAPAAGLLRRRLSRAVGPRRRPRWRDAVLAANPAAYVDNVRLAPGTAVAFAHGRTTRRPRSPTSTPAKTSSPRGSPRRAGSRHHPRRASGSHAPRLAAVSCAAATGCHLTSGSLAAMFLPAPCTARAESSVPTSMRSRPSISRRSRRRHSAAISRSDGCPSGPAWRRFLDAQNPAVHPGEFRREAVQLLKSSGRPSGAGHFRDAVVFDPNRSTKRREVIQPQHRRPTSNATERRPSAGGGTFCVEVDSVTSCGSTKGAPPALQERAVAASRELVDGQNAGTRRISNTSATKMMKRAPSAGGRPWTRRPTSIRPAAHTHERVAL